MAGGMSSDLDKRVEEALDRPRSVQTDAGSVSERPIREVIEGVRYLQSRRAAQRPHRGLRFTKLRPPGAE